MPDQANTSRSCRFLNSTIVLGITLLLHTPALADTTEKPLDGTWYFAQDPLKLGEENNWHRPPADWDAQKAAPAFRWDKITVPHCWNVDPRYQYIGVAWYQHSFKLPAAHSQARPQVYRLQFGAVYHRCKVWINGQYVGQHEGGFTPFEFDVTEHLNHGQYNLIAVAVDNSWTRHTLPGARVGDSPAHQIFPWWPNGGITRPVKLVTHDTRYVGSQLVQTKLDFANERVHISTTIQLCNKATAESEVQIQWQVADTDSAMQPIVSKQATIPLPADSTQQYSFEADLSLSQVQLWGLDTPELYFSEISLSGASLSNTHRERFGFRSIKLDGPRLLLNGQPIRLAGANRAFDHPVYGTIDTPEVVAEDGRLLKEAGLELARLQHQPLSETMLNWADEHGLLIIQEASCWGMGPQDLADPVIQEKYRTQLAETVNTSRNHPCVIGWSVGNEYHSWTPEGVAWTRMMKQFIREELHESRPVVCVTLGRAGRLFREQAEAGTLDVNATSLAHSDIICINWYGSPKPLGPILTALHKHLPDQPVIISENGMRADKGSPEVRAQRLRDTLALIREHEYVIGYSYWSFNDYRSMFPGTNPSGVRPWGLVDFDRNPRPLYHVVAEECAPLKLTFMESNNDHIKLLAQCRANFPAMAVKGYAVELRDEQDHSLATTRLPDLQPGEQTIVTLAPAAGTTPHRIVVVRPGGWLGMRIPYPAK